MLSQKYILSSESWRETLYFYLYEMFHGWCANISANRVLLNYSLKGTIVKNNLFKYASRGTLCVGGSLKKISYWKVILLGASRSPPKK